MIFEPKEIDRIDLENAQKKIDRKNIISGGAALGLGFLFLTAFALVCIGYNYFFSEWLKTALALILFVLVLLILLCLACAYYAVGIIILKPYIAKQETKNIKN